jgi:hypothetical protein
MREPRPSAPHYNVSIRCSPELYRRLVAYGEGQRVRHQGATWSLADSVRVLLVAGLSAEGR